MRPGRNRRGPNRALPVRQDRKADPRPKRNFGRWRALSLSLVYLIFAIHIIHWKVTGRTLAPLELNEVMYTLELGIITAGFLFMCFLVLGTLIFGRFFCSWACHIMVLQDLCAWILRKLGIRRKPIRSRLLLLVPPLTAFYMFIWPQILRAWRSGAFPEFHFRTDAEGWASIVTNNFWRNLPSAPIIVLTFLVCGFAIVYLLGSRTFCTYVCPYGAIFALADRFAPGRIQVNDDCQQCGTCTATCTSGVRVHEEVKLHGMIVNPACLKDLDCVGACPQHALHYGFTKPSLFSSFKNGGRFGRLPYDFSLGEETLMALLFVIVLASFRGLYSRIPFLLALALGGIIGYLAVLTVRLATRPDVLLATLQLRQRGRLTRAGRAFIVLAAVLTIFIGHSGFVRYHEFAGLRQAIAMDHAASAEDRDGLAASAHAHLATAGRWGLLNNERVDQAMVRVTHHLRRFKEVEMYAQRLLRRYPYDTEARLRLGESLASQDRIPEAEQAFLTIIAYWGEAADDAPPVLVSAHHALGGLLARTGRFAEAAETLRRAAELDPNRAAVHAELGSVLAERGQLDDAIASLREAVRLEPQMGRAQYNLGTILGHLGRFREAIPCYEQALANDAEDADLQNNLGFAFLRIGQVNSAREHFERAVAVDANNANAHFNLASVFASQHQIEQAAEHFRIAARLDPRYAQLLAD